MARQIEIFRDPATGYPIPDKVLAQFDDWSYADKFCNELWRLNNLYKIVDKNSRVITFKMKAEQMDLYIASTIHPRHCICKARQLGFSTLIQILFLDRAFFNSNENEFIIAQDKEAASAIMNTKIKFAYENLPEEIKRLRRVLKSNNDEILFDNNSKITVSVSARSATATAIHSSEMAKSYVKDPAKTHEFWTGSLPALVPNGLCFIESTAEGAQGDFYEAYTNKSADNPKDPNIFQRHFYSWCNTAEYESDFSPEEGIDSELRKYFTSLENPTSGSTDKPIFLTERKKNWYAGMSKTLGFKMKQEYPTTAKEAFEQSQESQVWGKQIQAMRAVGNVKPTRYIPNQPAFTFWDIGHTDMAAAWFVQYIDDEFRVFGYLEVHKGDVGWFIERMQNRLWRVNWIGLPHDADNKSFRDGKSVADEVQNWGYRPVVIPRSQDKIADIFKTGKHILECRFNSDPDSGVPDGLRRLENYRKKKAPDGGYLVEPQHDSQGNCDAADAFRAFAMLAEMVRQEMAELEADDDVEEFMSRKRDSVTGY